MTTENNLTLSDVLERLNDGIYASNGGKLKKLFKDSEVFDEDRTVKWNREKLEEENTKIKVHNERIKHKQLTGMDGFSKDLREVISNELGLNSGQAMAIYSHAWEEGHSVGESEVINYAIDMISLFKRVNEAGNN